MALPVTITGLASGAYVAGPFRNAGAPDAYYFFGQRQTDRNLVAFKSTAPDTSWAVVANKAGFANLNHVKACQRGSVIHMIAHQNDSTSFPVSYTSFDMATDTFLATTETVQAGGTNAGPADPVGVAIGVRSNGDVIAFYNSTYTSFYRLSYKIRTGLNTWSAATLINANSVSCSSPEVLPGASDRIHFIYAVNGVLAHRSLSSANVLDTEILKSGFAAGEGTSYVDGGDTKIAVACSALTTANFAALISGADPVITTLAGVVSGTIAGPCRVFSDGTKLWYMATRSDGDLYVVSSDDGGATWSTPAVSAMVAAVPNARESLSVDGNIYARGGNAVIPYLVNDAAVLKYNEYIVRALTPPAAEGAMAASEAADTASFAGTAAFVPATGALAASEAPDIASFAGVAAFVPATGALAASEAPDHFAASGLVLSVVSGIVAATEAPDIAAITGQTDELLTTGALAATEAPDTASITGVLVEMVTGILAATEAPDTASFGSGAVQKKITFTARDDAKVEFVGKQTSPPSWDAQA